MLGGFLLILACGGSDRAYLAGGEGEKNGHMVELAQFLDEQNSRVINVNYTDLKDPFLPDLEAPVIIPVRRPPMKALRKPPAPPKLILEGVARIKGVSTAFIDGASYRAGEVAGPFRLDDVANRSVIVSLGQEQWVVPVGDDLWRPGQSTPGQ